MVQKSLNDNSRKGTEEEETEWKRREFLQVVQDFVDSDNSSHEFPVSLSSHDRRLIHEIAEGFGIVHESEGTAKDRRLVLRKMCREPKQEKQSLKVLEVTADLCSTCDKSVPQSNLDLHLLRCKIPMLPTSVPSKSEKKEKGHKKKKKTKKLSDKTEEEDFDALLENFSKLDKICNFVKCKTKIATLGITCEHCRIRYCLEHAMPEVHGCGDAARAAARRKASLPVRQPSHTDEVRRKQLQRRLEKKVEELSAERKVKKKES